MKKRTQKLFINNLGSIQLTKRELEVLLLCAKGYTNNLIAEQLSITNHTVKQHLTSVYSKLNVCSRVPAVVKCLKLGYLDIHKL